MDDDIPNKQTLYGEWLRASRWRDNLHKSAAHKALDIPENDLNIQSDNRRFGTGVAGLLAVAATAGGLGIAGPLVASFLMNQPEIQPDPGVMSPPTQPADVRPPESLRIRLESMPADFDAGE